MTAPKVGSPVWVLSEEKETGYYGDYSTHIIISVHLTENGAEQARMAWLEDHEGNTTESHAFEGDDDCWCSRCHCGVSYGEVELCQ